MLGPQEVGVMDLPLSLSLFRVKGPFDQSMIKDILSLPGEKVIIDRDSVYSSLHLSSAIMHAARSIASGRSRAKARSMEVLRYVAGSRQVGEGSAKAGPRPGTTHILVVDLPEGWPSEKDGTDLPEMKYVRQDGPPSLEPMDEPDDGSLWGRELAIGVLGLSNTSEVAKAVLERIAPVDIS